MDGLNKHKKYQDDHRSSLITSFVLCASLVVSPSIIMNEYFGGVEIIQITIINLVPK